MSYLFFDRNIPCISEGTFGNGICDVLGIVNGRFVAEYEIKTSKADLVSELKSINFCFNNIESNKYNKLHKHQKMFSFYKRNIIDQSKVPNYFIIVVPYENLAVIALERLRGTPYGVYVVNYTKESGRIIKIMKQARQIHNEDVLAFAFDRILRKASETYIRNFYHG